MTKGIPLTPREIAEYERFFQEMDNLEEENHSVFGEHDSIEQMQLFEEVSG